MNGTKPAGWVVRVTTQQLVGGAPMTMLYAAAFFMPNEAEEAVRKRDRATPDEKVEAVDILSQTTLDRLGIGPGNVEVM